MIKKSDRPIKILILGDANSEHVIKWVNGLILEGCEVALLSLQKTKTPDAFPPHLKLIETNASLIKAWHYLKACRKVRQTIKAWHPDILHSHYATSYGLLGALNHGSTPLVISTWGSDIYDFPNKSIFNKVLLKFILNKSSRVTATSNALAKATAKYYSGSIDVIPFGINLSLFKAEQKNFSAENRQEIQLGFIKTLDTIYGVDILIHAFAQALKNHPNMSLTLIGGGPKKNEYESLSKSLNISDHVVFIDRVKNSEVPTYLGNFDIYLSLSRMESFGVSLIEAMACGVPAIVTNTPGFREISENGQLCTLIPIDDAEAATGAIEAFINNPNDFKAKAKRAQESVVDKYDWQKNLQQMLTLYSELI